MERRARSGRLRRVHRGVYAVGGAVLPREGRWLAAVMACGPGAVLSHVSAAVLWNLLQYDAPHPEVTAPASRHGRPGDPPAPLAFPRCPGHHHHQGIPVTTIHRTCSTSRRTYPSDHLERALAQAERLQLYDHRAIEERVTEPTATVAQTPRTAIASDRSAHRGELKRACASSPATTACRGRVVQRHPRCPRPPRPRGRLLLPDAAPGRGDRRLGHPPHRRLRIRPRQGRRPDRRRLHRRPLHLPPAPRRPAAPSPTASRRSCRHAARRRRPRARGGPARA